MKGHRFQTLFESLPNSTWGYPGDWSDTTLGGQRPHLEGRRKRG